MKLAVDKERFRVYLVIAAIYLGLNVFRDLFESPETFFQRFWNNIWLISYLLILNYIFFEVYLSSLRLSLKSFILAPLFFFIFAMLYSFAFYGWRSFGVTLGLYFPLRDHVNIYKGVEYHAPYSFFSIIFFGGLKHAYNYRKLKAAAQQLRIEKQEAELNYLKSQTNPHFLFNTLNNIYSLSRDKSDLAPESILRLSKILRYMLYETGGAFIAIEQELKIMTDYIALEKLRYDESLHVNFNTDIEDVKQAIPPLLLIPLVENAFKHGVSETRSQPFVDIHLAIKNRQLTFVVKNSAETSDPGTRVKENIGLSNLRRQLQLLYTEYELVLKPGDSVFTATLKINLASHV
jgi:two-component system, LytTR family, sensor kinase